MSHGYHVTTPDEDEWVDSPDEVSKIVARYMEERDASLNHVSVFHLPDTGETTGSGQPLSPADFWGPASSS